MNLTSILTLTKSIFLKKLFMKKKNFLIYQKIYYFLVTLSKVYPSIKSKSNLKFLIPSSYIKLYFKLRLS